MKGIILAGGFGTRLMPCTTVTNKHLLPVYNKPMIYYPLNILLKAGIKEIMIVTGPEYAGHFINLLKSGKQFGVKFQYALQEKAGGIAEALGLAEDFAEGESVAVILGDNVFDETFELLDFKDGARIYLKEVPDPERFGVVQEFEGTKVKSIVEKPKNPKTNFAVTGLFLYDSRVFDIIKTLKPSGRGELEITDVNNKYISMGKMDSRVVKRFWSDAGTFESLNKASNYVKDNLDRFKF